MALKSLTTKARAMLGFRPPQTNSKNPDPSLLVVIFLRGGADGLSIVAPYADDGYYKNRILTAMPKPGTSIKKSLIDLNGFFGLHPSLAPLYPLYRQGELGFVHACGSGDRTLSHFSASNTVERGVYEGDGDSSGWLSRFLDASAPHESSAIRAVSLSALLPASLDGTSCAIALQNIDDLLLHNPFNQKNFAVKLMLHQMYSRKDLVGEAASQTLSMIDLLQTSRKQNSVTTTGYGTSLSGNLRQIADLSRCDAGLAVACVDQSGYDTHVVQGGVEGILSGCLSDLANAITSFIANIGPEKWKSTKIVVMSEFGRRVHENDGGGTDHGHGNMMMILGGSGVNGGKVHGNWLPLTGAGLDQNGNIKSTTDYRNVLRELVSTQIGNAAAATVFPGLQFRPVGLTYV